jgi:hypothetical protein
VERLTGRKGPCASLDVLRAAVRTGESTALELGGLVPMLKERFLDFPAAVKTLHSALPETLSSALTEAKVAAALVRPLEE